MLQKITTVTVLIYVSTNVHDERKFVKMTQLHGATTVLRKCLLNCEPSCTCSKRSIRQQGLLSNV